MSCVVMDGATLVADDLDWRMLEALGPTVVYQNTIDEERYDKVKDARAVITNKVPFDRALLAQLPKLEYIGVSATGYNIIDIEACEAHSITVTNVPSYADNAVAQHVFALLLNHTNRIALHEASVKRGDWLQSRAFSYTLAPLTELKDKTIGLIGFGRIAKKVASVAQAFSMKVIAYTPNPKEVDKVEFLTLEEVFSQSDVLSLHCPLNNKTKSIVNAQTLGLMKRNAILINTGRGELVEEAALAASLHERAIQAAFLDVLSSEPPTEDNPLLKSQYCHITPHIAWAAVEARQRLLSIVCDNYQSFLQGQAHNVVTRQK